MDDNVHGCGGFTAYHSIGRIVLIAAVRRIRRPGAKFDNILVLEGAQGGGKSTAIKILAGAENFSDQDILTLDPKAQMEALEGVWIYEICELKGLSRADTAKVKAFASRAVDQGRPAYARFKEARPRQAILIGTTNDDKYLRDTTGNRRFWPVKVGWVSLEVLLRDRDQLWAEAAYWEAKDESLVLAEDLWPFARVSTADLLTVHLEIPQKRQNQFHTKRFAAVMRKLGWQGPIPLKLSDGETVRGYQHLLRDEHEDRPGFAIKPAF